MLMALIEIKNLIILNLTLPKIEKIKEIGYGFRVVGAGTSSHDYGIFVSPVL